MAKLICRLIKAEVERPKVCFQWGEAEKSCKNAKYFGIFLCKNRMRYLYIEVNIYSLYCTATRFILDYETATLDSAGT